MIVSLYNSNFAVSGDANFEMKLTGLTLGGFLQPSIARNLLEQPANVEKGLCQRFSWFVAKPTPIPFDDLERVDRHFSASIGTYNNIIHACAECSHVPYLVYSECNEYFSYERPPYHVHVGINIVFVILIIFLGATIDYNNNNINNKILPDLR